MGISDLAVSIEESLYDATIACVLHRNMISLLPSRCHFDALIHLIRGVQKV